MASQVLGGAFGEGARDVQDDTKIKYEGTSFIKDSSGSLTAGGRVGTTSFMARFKANSETANTNRTTYQAIQEQLSNGHPEIAKAFGNNFWFSKMMGKPITKGTVINFLDQKIKEQEGKANEQAERAAQPLKTSIFARLFGGIFGGSSSPKQDMQRAEKETGARIANAQTGGAAAAAQRDQIRGQRLGFVLGNLADKISEQKFPDFKTYVAEAGKEAKGKLSSSERKVVTSLSQHAQGNAGFSIAVNKCFNGTTDSIKEAKTPEAKKAATKDELSRLYQLTESSSSVVTAGQEAIDKLDQRGEALKGTADRTRGMNNAADAFLGAAKKL